MVLLFYLTSRWDLNRYYRSKSECTCELWQWRGILIALRDLSLTIRCSRVLYLRHRFLMEGVLSLCRKSSLRLLSRTVIDIQWLPFLEGKIFLWHQYLGGPDAKQRLVGWILRHANSSGYFMPKKFLLFLFGIIFMRLVIWTL